MYRVKTYKEEEDESSIQSSNNIKLILFNNEAVLGDKLHGAVKIDSDYFLPEGRVVLVLESVLKINKPVRKTRL